MFRCFVNLFEGDAFLSLGSTSELYRSLRVFFEKYGLQFFFQKFRCSYVTIHRQRGFQVDCYEMSCPFWKIMDCKHIFPKV
jgi:hypothetical protein